MDKKFFKGLIFAFLTFSLVALSAFFAYLDKCETAGAFGLGAAAAAFLTALSFDLFEGW